MLIARSGYTGEDGFELFIPLNVYLKLHLNLMTIVPLEKATWVGLAARNTLRLEAGFCLHGHEITEEISPLEAGILWAVSMKKCDFVGKDAINNQIKVSEHGKVFHYKVNSRRIPRDNAEIFFKSEKAGKVLSGAFSPILKCPFGSAYVDKGFIKKARESGWYAVVRDNTLPLEFCKPVLKNI